MKKFAALRAKIYAYLTDKNNKYRKSKDTKKCIIKVKPKFEGYKHYLQETQLKNKIIQQ